MGTGDAQHTEELTVETELEGAIAPTVPTDSSVAPLFTNPADWFVPVFPERLEDLDVSVGCLSDLALKTVPLESDCTTASIAARMHLGMVITESLLQRLTREKFIEIKRLGRHTESSLWDARQRLAGIAASDKPFCSYAGPAPVSLKSYTEMITQQVRNRPPASRQALDQAMSNLIISDYAKEILGLVVASGRSLFLTGPSGNGKTATARALVDAIPVRFGSRTPSKSMGRSSACSTRTTMCLSRTRITISTVAGREFVHPSSWSRRIDPSES